MACYKVSVSALIGLVALASIADARLPDPASPGLMETLVRGAEHREAIAASIGALCTHEIFLSERQLSADRQLSSRGDLGTRALDIVRFRWSGQQWWMEVLELYSSGWNNWCFLGALSPGWTIDDHGSSSVRAMEFSDGVRVWQVDLRHPAARVMEASGSGVLHGSFGTLAHTLLLRVNDKPLSRFLRELKSPVIEALEDIDGNECYRVADYRPGPGGVGGYMVAVWIAPDRGFAPVRFEDLFMPGDKREGQRYVRLCTDMTEVAPGLWLPMEATQHVYGYVGDEPQVWRWTRVVKVQSWDLDVPICNRLGETMLPLGTTVMGASPLEAGQHVVGNTQRIVDAFDPGAPPPPIDAARARPLVSTDLKENAWP